MTQTSLIKYVQTLLISQAALLLLTVFICSIWARWEAENGERVLTFNFSHLACLLKKKNDALAAQSWIYTNRNCDRTLPEEWEYLLTFFFNLPLSVSSAAVRLPVCSNQKFIQSCIGSLRLATAMRSLPRLFLNSRDTSQSGYVRP